MEMEKKNVAIIILAVILAASGVGNILLGMQLGLIEVVPPPKTQDLVFGAVSGNIVWLDPHMSYDTASNDVIDQIVEQLYQFNLSDPSFGMIPWLATDFPTISPNGLEYTISLRTGIKYHDGTDFNATTMKWSLDRLMYFMNYSSNADLPAPFNVSLPAGLLPTQLGILYEQPDGKRVINRTEVIGSHTIKIVLNAPKGSFMPVLAYTASGALSPASTPPLRYYELSEKLVGTGPFIYKYYVADIEVKFDPNPGYWGTPDNLGPTKLTSLTYSIIPDLTTMLQGLLAGDIDLTDSMLASFIPQLEADPDVEIIDAGNSLTIGWIAFNYLRINITMRKAIAWCYNYSYVIDVVTEGLNLRLPSPIPWGIPFANYSLNAPNYPDFVDYTIAQDFLLNDVGYAAKLATAGITDTSPDSAWIALANGPTPLESYNYSWNIGNDVARDQGERLSFDMERIGVKLTVIGKAWADHLDDIVNHRDELDLYRLGWAPDYLDPENYINPMFDNGSSTNGGNFWEYDVQTLMDAGLTETDPVAREHIYNEIQRLMVEEYLPALWMYTGRNFDAWRVGVKGWQPNPLARVWMHPVYFE